MKSIQDWSIRWRVAGHLLLILLLILANFGGVWWFLQQQRHDGNAINEAGEQRMLTQRIAFKAHLIGMGYGGLRDNLAADAAEYNRTLVALIDGNQSMGIPPAPPSVRAQLLDVRAEWQPFYAHVQTVLEKPRTNHEFNESLAYIEAHNGQLLIVSGNAVQSYERVYDKKQSRFHLFLIVIFGVDLIVIPLLFVYVDRDILRPINRLTTDVQRIAQGNIGQSITTTDTADELGVLSRSIHEMNEQLVLALQEARKFEKAVEHAGHAIYITDTDGIIEYVNLAFEEITKYDQAEAVGENPRILQSGMQSETYYETLWETIQSGKIWEGELINQRATGERYYASQTIAPITDEDGNLDQFVAVTTDRTEQIVSEQQMQVLRRVVRHNLRTELNLIDGYAQELASAENAEARREYLHDIRGHVENLEELSNTANRVMRELNQTISRGSQSVRETTERVVASMVEQHPQAEITTDLPGYEIDVLAKVSLVLEELVENAIVHNDQTIPEVTVKVTLREETASTPSMEIIVKDNGPGIPESEREVLESGEETSLYHASGLGLWNVHWTVILAGGELSIDERTPRGTAVSIVLPQASPAPFPHESVLYEGETIPETDKTDDETTKDDD